MMASTCCLLYNILILFHIATSNENWFIATNITLNWTPLKTKEPTVLLSLCVTTKPIATPNNCNFMKKTVENSGMLTLLSSDFDFSASAKQLEINQNSTGYFIVQSTSNSSNFATASNILNILQTVVISTPILGGTLSAYKPQLIQNPFNLMINKQIFEGKKNDTILAASFVIIQNVTSYEYIQICSVQLLFSSHTAASQTDADSPYVTISNIKGIQLDPNNADINYGGPYFLLIGLKNTTTKSWTNYYEINRNDSNINWFNDNLYKYLLYNDNAIKFDLALIKFGQYDDVSMSIGVGNELTSIAIYVAMINKFNNKSFIAQCSKHEYTFYNSFGWKYLPNIQAGMVYNPLMYWTKVADGFEISSNSLSSLDISITKTSITPIIKIKNHTFYAGATQQIYVTDASVNIPTNISLQIEQCINNKCNLFADTLTHIQYRKKEQSDIEMTFPDTLQSNFKSLTNGLKTYLMSAIDLCATSENITTRTEIEILPLFSTYIIGDVLSNEVKWDNLLFPPHDKLIELRLLYWDNDEFNREYNVLSFGMIENNGTLKNFQPNLTMNAKHLLVNNGNVGIFNLYSNTTAAGSAVNIYEVNITSRVYNLFQAFSINAAVNGTVVAKDDNYKKHYTVKGMIANTLINNATFKFNVYLTNITDNKSLNITSTAKQYKLNNITSIIDNKHCITNITKHDTNITYCPFTLTFNDELNDTNDMINDGEYILGISRYRYKFNAYDTNYFYVNNFNEYENKSYQFLVYSQKQMIVDIDTTTTGAVNIASYQYKTMEISGGDFTGMIYLTLENINGKNIFIFYCGPQWMDSYKSFGWKFIDIKNKNGANIISGDYVLKMYWNTPSTLSSIGTLNSNRYELITNGKIAVKVTMNTAAPSVKIISVKDESNTNNIPFRLNKGGTNSFSFSSNIAVGSKVNVYYQQCKNATFDCVKHYPKDEGKPYSFYFQKNSETHRINVPNSLKTDLSTNDNSPRTYLVMDIDLCDANNNISTRQNITINGESKNNTKLKAGAILGIICAVVLVLGLAAWWLFMRNSSGDGYRTLME